MNQFKDVFLGREKRDYKRATTSQKCMRVSGKHNDLDNVGPSHRHHTFFEMLGNFSFGDYFKEDAIRFAWTVLTDVWGLPKDRLRASIFAGDATTPRDDEAFAIWKGILGDASRIDEFGAADNFWQMGETGPCGRCSEIFYDRRGMAHVPADDQLIEVWNNVFMEFNRVEGGVLAPAAGPLDRHRHGPRTHHRGDSGQDVELRHRPVPADPLGHRRPGRRPLRRRR